VERERERDEGDENIYISIKNKTYCLIFEFSFKFQQEDSSIYEFKAEAGGKVLIGVCKENEEAINAYDDSIASGHTAYMLAKGNVHSLNILWRKYFRT
jgi:hypothetical protein